MLFFFFRSVICFGVYFKINKTRNVLGRTEQKKKMYFRRLKIMKSLRRYERCHRILEVTGFEAIAQSKSCLFIYIYIRYNIYILFLNRESCVMRLVYLLINVYVRGKSMKDTHNLPSEKPFFFFLLFFSVCVRGSLIQTNRLPRATDYFKVYI